MNYKISKLHNDKLEFAHKLEKRTEVFADSVIVLCKNIQKNTINNELVSQLIRAACSVGANYIEANESLSKKDFYHRIKISRKEAKEAGFWLKRLIKANPQIENEAVLLINEAREYVLIFSKVISHS